MLLSSSHHMTDIACPHNLTARQHVSLQCCSLSRSCRILYSPARLTLLQYSGSSSSHLQTLFPFSPIDNYPCRRTAKGTDGAGRRTPPFSDTVFAGDRHAATVPDVPFHSLDVLRLSSHIELVGRPSDRLLDIPTRVNSLGNSDYGTPPPSPLRPLWSARLTSASRLI